MPPAASGPLQHDQVMRRVTWNGQRVPVAGRPYEALVALMKVREKGMSREDLYRLVMNQASGSSPGGESRSSWTTFNRVVSDIREALCDTGRPKALVFDKPTRKYFLFPERITGLGTTKVNARQAEPLNGLDWLKRQLTPEKLARGGGPRPEHVFEGPGVAALLRELTANGFLWRLMRRAEIVVLSPPNDSIVRFLMEAVEHFTFGKDVRREVPLLRAVITPSVYRDVITVNAHDRTQARMLHVDTSVRPPVMHEQANQAYDAVQQVKKGEAPGLVAANSVVVFSPRLSDDDQNMVRAVITKSLQLNAGQKHGAALPYWLDTPHKPMGGDDGESSGLSLPGPVAVGPRM